MADSKGVRGRQTCFAGDGWERSTSVGWPQAFRAEAPGQLANSKGVARERRHRSCINLDWNEERHSQRRLFGILGSLFDFPLLALLV
jgi:hypothetical protein